MLLYKLVADTDEGPGEIYRAIKAPFLRLLETEVERKLRVRNEWTQLYKGRNINAIQFEADSERIHSETTEVGV